MIKQQSNLKKLLQTDTAAFKPILTAMGNGDCVQDLLNPKSYFNSVLRCYVCEHTSISPTDFNSTYKSDSLIYEEALYLLLHKLDYRQLHPTELRNIYPELEMLLLSELAYKYTLNATVTLPKNEVIAIINSSIEQNLNFPNLEAGDILNLFEDYQGILINTPSGYSFIDPTLQHYFTGRYIAENKLVDQVIDEHINKPEWEKAFPFALGSLRSDPSNFLIRITDKAKSEHNNKETKRIASILSNCMKELRILPSFTETT